jgi:hypothetical protein
MFLQLRPICRTVDSTVSGLWIDGKYHSAVLEDGIRTKKIPGKTAIPAGIYTMIRDDSSKFIYQWSYCWHIINVPGFEEIKIHKGNTILDTRGCLLPNSLIGFDGVNFYGSGSKPAYDLMMGRLENELTHKIEIIR